MKTPAYLASDKLPRWGQWVMVVTPFGRCLGFLDPQEEWRDARDGSLLKDVQSWHLMEAGRAHAMQSALERDPVRALPGHLLEKPAKRSRAG